MRGLAYNPGILPAENDYSPTRKANAIERGIA